MTIAEIGNFIKAYKGSSERTFLAQNNSVEPTIQAIEAILNTGDADDEKKQKIVEEQAKNKEEPNK